LRREVVRWVELAQDHVQYNVVGVKLSGIAILKVVCFKEWLTSGYEGMKCMHNFGVDVACTSAAEEVGG
jgi:hypothetical protein